MEMASPIQGRVTCHWRQYKGHAGIDIAAPNYTPVYSAFAGTVVKTGWNCVSGRTGYGILLRHPVTGEATYYGHLSKVQTRVGATVAVGEQIGLSGSTGNVTGPHLHFEVWGSWKNGQTNYDPRKAFDARGITPGSTQGQKTTAATTAGQATGISSGGTYYTGGDPAGEMGHATVKALQAWLQAQGFYQGSQVDGDYGPLTVAALQELLTAHGLYQGRIDGDEGPLTNGAFQLFLRSRGYYMDGQIDGVKGPYMVRAIQAFLSR